MSSTDDEDRTREILTRLPLGSDAYLNQAQTARIIGVTRERVRQLVNKGKLRGSMIPWHHKPVIERAEIVRFLKERRAGVSEEGVTMTMEVFIYDPWETCWRTIATADDMRIFHALLDIVIRHYEEAGA